MIKSFLERYLLFSRWLLAPFFIMLTLGLFALMINAGKRLWVLLHLIISTNEERVSLELLNLIDMTLTGALVVIVTISVYENFVSTVDEANHKGWPDWMGNIDFSQLKLKLLSTIVAISAIKLLEAFMDIPDMNDRDLNYYMAIHLTFVVSTLAFAFSERVSSHSGAAHGPQAAPAESEATHSGEPPPPLR